MSRVERFLGALNPKRWPVRWRLAAVSATLTLIILVAFALVVGRLVDNRLQNNFNDEVRDTATRLAFDFQQLQPCDPRRVPPDLRETTLAGAAAIRIVTPTGGCR